MKLENYKKIVELQHSFNILTRGEDYLEQGLNWNSAIIDESAELLKSLGYEWWKKTEVDLDNAKVEAIDLLHFVISELIQIYYADNCNLRLEYISEQFCDIFEDNDETYMTKLNLLQIIDILNYGYESEDRFIVLKEIFKKLEMSNEDVYIAYIVKNCLNKFRQDNGYKEGTYQKIWIDKEDNVFAYELAKNIGADENLFDLLYADLEATYSYYFKSGVKA